MPRALTLCKAIISETDERSHSQDGGRDDSQSQEANNHSQGESRSQEAPSTSIVNEEASLEIVHIPTDDIDRSRKRRTDWKGFTIPKRKPKRDRAVSRHHEYSSSDSDNESDGYRSASSDSSDSSSASSSS